MVATFLIEGSKIENVTLFVHELRLTFGFGSRQKLRRIVRCRSKSHVRHSSLTPWTRIGFGPVSLNRNFLLFTYYLPCPPVPKPPVLPHFRASGTLRYFSWFPSVNYQLVERRPLQIHRAEKIGERFWSLPAS